MNRRDRAAVRWLATAFMAVEFSVAWQVVSPALARAGADPAALVERLRADGFTGSDQALVANAKWVCARFAASDWNFDQVADKFREDNPMEHGQAVLFVADSTAYLCPAYGPRRGQQPGDEIHRGVVV